MADNIFDGQFQNRCADLVLDLHECFEAYGISRGYKLCKDYQTDINECNDWTLRQRAVNEIYRVRTKKMLNGEIKPKDAYLPKAEANSFAYFPNHK